MNANSLTLSKHHCRLGWMLLAIFALLGLIIEGMHGLKLQWYVSVVNSTRREMLTLAHAHGTLLALVHIVFAVVLAALPKSFGSMRLLASRLLSAASLLMPLGFFLGGVQFYGGDPGLGILLVPVGATCLIVSAGIGALHPGIDDKE